MSALGEDDLDSRIVEALPWLIFNFPDLDWAEVIKRAKLNDAQNRLGFLMSLAFELAKQSRDENKSALFKELLLTLEKSRLIREDSFRQHYLTETEKAWLKRNRPKEARRWRVLSNLSTDHLVY